MIDGLPTDTQTLEMLIETLQRSNLVILVVPPAMEQASLVHSIALNATISGQQGVALFSPAVSKYRVVQRLLALSAGIDLHRLRTGQISDDERRHIKVTANRLSIAHLWIDDTSSLSIEVLQQRVQQLVEQHDVTLVIVDHVYFLRFRADGKKDGDPWQDVYDISRGLRTLTHTLHIPVIAVAPLTHPIETLRQRTLQRSDIPDLSPEAGTEHILFLHRDEPSPVETSRRLIIATILITKQQDGQVTEVDILTQADLSV